MKNIRSIRILSVALSLLLVIGVISISRGTVLADTIDPATGLQYTISGGKATITGYIAPAGFSGDLTIPGVLGEAPVTSIRNGAFFENGDLTSVVIPSSVTSIGDGAFYSCENLANVTIPNGVTSIGIASFFGCTDLTNITIPSSVNSIGLGVFSSCDNLISISVNTANPTFKSADGVLYSKDGTQLIAFPGGKSGSFTIPASVTSIGGSTFSGCTGLTAIEIPNSVEIIGFAAFQGCTGLTSILIPNSVTDIDMAAFYECSNLSSAYFFGNTPSIDNFVFMYCASDFTVRYLSTSTGFANPWNGYAAESFSSYTDTVTGLTYSFAAGKATVTGFSAPSGFSGALAIPSSIGGVPVTGIAGDALVNGAAVTSISVPSTVTSIGDGVFSDCAILTAINVDAANTTYKSADGILFSKDGTVLLRYPAGKTGNISIPSGVTSIGVEAFSGCAGLTSISIPESVTSIGDEAFSGCSNLSIAKFYGNAPAMGSDVFAGSASGFTVRYRSTATGFTNPWNGYTALPLYDVTVSYRTHVQDVGWQGYVSDGAASGTSGQSKRLEAINIKLDLEGIDGGIEYRTHVQDIGWQGWVADDALSGTSGQSKRLEAIQIRLTGDLADAFDVYYRVHAQNVGWMGWAKNGQSSGTAGHSYRLEAIEIKLVEKGEAAPGSTAWSFIDKYEPANTVQYKTHVQDIGWQDYVRNGATSGTSGQSKRLESIQIKLNNIEGGIEYRTHVQDYGWMAWAS
ncbi:MAG: leucine-rich repeat protein, partial [Oscillospiraceae bacterium]|nr:leucine-rich repeat protein [Oscillospiraceae bacterium]